MSESANSLYQSNGMISSFMPNNGVTAKSNMIFQEYLSNTAHQREMADLKAAGLNPWLSSNSGASVPSGSIDSADVLQLLNGLNKTHGPGANSAQVADAGKKVIENLFGVMLGRNWGKLAGSVIEFMTELQNDPFYVEQAQSARAKIDGSYAEKYSREHGIERGQLNKNIGKNILSFFSKLFGKS